MNDIYLGIKHTNMSLQIGPSLYWSVGLPRGTEIERVHVWRAVYITLTQIYYITIVKVALCLIKHDAVKISELKYYVGMLVSFTLRALQPWRNGPKITLNRVSGRSQSRSGWCGESNNYFSCWESNTDFQVAQTLVTILPELPRYIFRPCQFVKQQLPWL